MNRLIGGMAAAALFVVAACSAGTSATNQPTSPIGTGAIGSAVGDAKAALCDSTSQSSLKGLQSQLANVTPNSDTTSLQTAIGDAETNLNSLQVTGDQTTLKQAALSALQSVQSGLNNPSTIAETATSASTALSALDSSLCM
jgi:hypothetical protein